MPKHNKKSSKPEVVEDFDDMLAESSAADLANVPPSYVAPMAMNQTPANASSAHVPEKNVAEATILAAIRAGDLARLRRWHRQGVEMAVEHLYVAAETGSVTVMQCMIEDLGADLNRVSDDGITPLVVASSCGHLHLVRYLITTLGADVNKTYASGPSPLLVAALNDHLEIVRCLLTEFGADFNLARDHGATPLMHAAAKGHLAVVRCLGREHGADINKSDHHGCIALIYAAEHGHMNVVKCLVVELSADVNLAAHDGRTALMLASLKKCEKVVRWLIKHGADIGAKTAYGTAVDASRPVGASFAQTEYLEAKAHCSNPGCSGTGLKKCTGCKQVRYCGQACQLAH
jgi:ankyrin repeat protein